MNERGNVRQEFSLKYGQTFNKLATFLAKDLPEKVLAIFPETDVRPRLKGYEITGFIPAVSHQSSDEIEFDVEMYLGETVTVHYRTVQGVRDDYLREQDLEKLKKFKQDKRVQLIKGLVEQFLLQHLHLMPNSITVYSSYTREETRYSESEENVYHVIRFRAQPMQTGSVITE